ncbi:PREDICTED: uncharacterized protein LOC106749705 [Dinoponera quadriceps]|uniref:Uncharacterized protein LOC106749705 n=1 Tax=Dinoponera quadriceps TaxID=609295 RepID=A0A6P3Y3P4_DINQU|nr:PREDICTED: uncharacterized protein LOC106749705 [Dinoponera quadriceps]
MNASGKNHVTIVGASFHENVFLLTQVVPPSLEFQKHFKKNMFDKPNIAGFLHVSYYLSVIYDAKLFKQMVSWPLSCKKDEVMYRSAIKGFLSVLSRDNPDVNFPTILTSHLAQAGGAKFLIIMWKVSQLALRAYIKKQFQGDLLNAPRLSPADDLTIAYFNGVIAERCRLTREMHRKAKRVLDTASNFLKSEMELQSIYKSEIFDRTQNIKKLVFDMSVHPLVQKQLMDVQDSNIVNIWKRNISKNLQYICSRNEKLSELEESCRHLCKLVSKIISNSGVLDANKLPRINDDNRFLRTQDLYTNGSIAFSTLLSLVSLASARILHRINIADSSDLSRCSLYIEKARKNIKVLRSLFVALDVKLTGLHLDEQRISGRVTKVPVCLETDSASFIAENREILLESPEISFDLDQRVDNDHFHKTLCPSPTEGEHKHLFRRHKRKYCPYEWPVAPSSFSESSWNHMNGWLSPRAYSLKSELITPNGKSTSSLYSRLLASSKSSPKRSAGSS